MHVDDMHYSWEQYCVWMADSAVQAALISAVFLFFAGPPT